MTEPNSADPSAVAYYHYKKAMFHLSQAEDAMSQAGLSREYETVAKTHSRLYKLMQRIWGKE